MELQKGVCWTSSTAYGVLASNSWDSWTLPWAQITPGCAFSFLRLLWTLFILNSLQKYAANKLCVGTSVIIIQTRQYFLQGLSKWPTNIEYKIYTSLEQRKRTQITMVRNRQNLKFCTLPASHDQPVINVLSGRSQSLKGDAGAGVWVLVSCWPLALTLTFVGTWTGEPAEALCCWERISV